MMRLVVILISLFVAGLCQADDQSLERLSPIAEHLALLEAQRPLCDAPDSAEAEPYKAQMRAGLATTTQPGLIGQWSMSPIDYAVMADDVGALKRLSGYGYRLTTSDAHGGSLLGQAVRYSSTDLVTFLLDSGLDPNELASSGSTPLMVAASGQGTPEMVRLLLKRGATANLRLNSGTSALHWALICAKPEVIQLLLDAGAEVDDRALEMAAKSGLDSLLDMKANNRQKDDAQELRAP